MNAPVLVLGGVPRITTAIARSLHAHKIPVDVATFSLLEPRIPSRAIRHWARIPDPHAAPSEFVNSVRALVKKHGYDMVIPANDNSLVAIHDHFHELQACVQVAAPPPEILSLVLDKNKTLDIGSNCGIRVPRTAIVHDSGQLAQQANTLGFPMILKSGQKFPECDFKVRYLGSSGELAKVFPQGRQFSPAMILQEYCPGEGVGVEMLVHQGQPIAVFQHRRVKELPRSGGVAVVAISEAPDPTLVDSSLNLLRSLEWQGVAMVEFRHNPATRTATLMEVNGRYWGSIPLAIQAGIDFPLYQWQLAHGERPAVPKSYAVDMRCRWTAGYVRRMRDILPGCFRPDSSGSFFRDLLGSPLDFSPSVRDALWSASDPMPAIFELGSTFRDWAAADVRSFLQRFLTRH